MRTLLAIMIVVTFAIVFSAFCAAGQSMPSDTKVVGARDMAAFDVISDPMTKAEIVQLRRQITDDVVVDKFSQGFAAGIAVSVLVCLICGVM